MHMYMTAIKEVKYRCDIVFHFDLIDRVEIFRAHPYQKPYILFCSNGLAIWYCMSDIRHIKVNYGRWFDFNEH